jgi:asparagine synthase (glutamine-hydrolysing)
MSGIAGIYYLNNQPVCLENLVRVSDRLAHRGPDGANLWAEESVGFVHRMLWTTQESLLETQPEIDRTGNLVLTADVRIDNRSELIEKLSLSDRPAEKVTDTQLILAAYEQWGDRCPNYLLGDFAFAIWDKRQQHLFCARDRFGVKPFYYHYRAGQHFCFASEIKGVLCFPEVPHQINEARIADYLYPMLEDPKATAYQGIFRLPAARTLTVKRNGAIECHSYWSLTLTEELQLGSDREYAEAFRSLFAEAVNCRLRSAFPVGSHLSGGLDSSAVTCMAREWLHQSPATPLHTFSNVFDEVAECDERSFIQAVLADGGVIPHEVHPDRTGALSDWETLFRGDEEPCLLGANGYLVWGLNRATQQAGVRVVLDGFDGDTTVSHGTGYFAELARQGGWKTFINEAKGLSQHFETSPTIMLYRYGFPYLEELANQGQWSQFARTVRGISKNFTVSQKKLWWRYGCKPIVPQHLKKMWRSLRSQTQPDTALIHPDFARRIGIQDRVSTYTPPQPLAANDQEEQFQAFTSGSFALVLEQVDLAAAACSIETRHPFLDLRLVEFCMSLPIQQKLHQGWSRTIMRRALQGILPESIQWRGGKTDMSAACSYGLRTYNRELLDQTVGQPSTCIEPYINLNVLRQSYSRLMSGGTTQDADVSNIWRATGLALWLQQNGAIA